MNTSEEDTMPTSKPDLTYEEMPVIDPATGETVEEVDSTMSREDVIPEAARVFQTHLQPEQVTGANHDHAISGEHTLSTPPRKRSFHLGTVIFVVLLFGLGIWLSSQLRSLFAPALTDTIAPTPEPGINPTFAMADRTSTNSAVGTSWLSYVPVNGITKQPIAGISYKLPSNVTAPVCDNASCSSQGTNLPGGTRLTVAPRGKGQLLPDFRGAILTDATGREFSMKQSVIGGVYVYEYSGTFTGKTGGGYTFSKMRGALVPVSDVLAIDFNHFSPVGAAVDFAADDAVFEKIIQSFASAGSSPSPLPTTVLPTPTGTDMYGL